MKRKKILSYVVLALVMVFSIYEIIVLSLDLCNYCLEMPKSKTSYIVGVIMFSLILVATIAITIYMIIQDKRKKYYILKK